MTFLPIVGRELRAASRRSGTYWVRALVVSQATLAGVAAWLIETFDGRVKFGTALFWGLAGVSLMHCVFAGRRSTADCLSVEKRDGTMGLLFLTDLKGYDVVIGKLVASSLGGFYGLLGVFPILAVPLLVGGMTDGEFWRMMLTLLVTFGFSLAIGIFCSAGSREYKETIGRNFLLLTTASIILPMIGATITLNRGYFEPACFWACPFFAFVFCADTVYATHPLWFWQSLAVMHGLSWLLVARACRIVPSSWQDEPSAKGKRRGGGWWKRFKRALNYGSEPGRNRFRKWALDRNAYLWLAARERLKPAHVWAFLATAAMWWCFGWTELGPTWLDESSCVVMGLLLTVTMKLWVTVEAGQRLATDREAGAMELLLCTPLTVNDYLRGQLQALRRQFLRPFVVAVVALVALASIAVNQRSNSGWLPWVAGLALLPADLAALGLDGMWSALLCKTHTRATLVTVVRILALPWIGYWLVMGVCFVLREMEYVEWSETPLWVKVWTWLLLGLATDAAFGWHAWRKLHTEFRDAAMQRYGAKAARTEEAAKPRTAKSWRPTAAGAAVVALCSLALLAGSSSSAPPEVVVTLEQSNAPVKFFAGWNGGIFFVMPDGTLWRWGRPDGPRFSVARQPEQVGTNRDWEKLTVLNGPRVFALRQNGTTWEWGDLPGGQFTNEPTQRNHESDWKDVGVTARNRVALKRDGTMWAWAPAWGSVSFDPARRFPRQVGTATNWGKMISAEMGVFGIQSNGTLWYWGETASGMMSEPARACAESNWVDLSEDGVGTTREGVSYEVRRNRFAHAPDATQSADAAFGAPVRGDPAGERYWTWQWTSALGGGMGPSLSLTKDGTVMTQGIDPGGQSRPTFWMRLLTLKQKLLNEPTFMGMQGFDNKPRALMKLVYAPDAVVKNKQ